MSPRMDPLSRAMALGLGAALLLAAAGAWLLSRHEADAPAPLVLAEPPPAAPGVEEAPRARVLGVVGVVQRGQGERWVALVVGEVLDPEDAVRTGPGARVELRVGDEASRLSIPERSEVRMEAVTRAVHTIRLERGRIDVDYREREARVLRVHAQGGVVAETRAAHFTLLRRGAMVAVVTRGGTVDLSAEGATIQIGAGQQGLVFEGARPLGPEPIPLEVLLRVAANAPASGEALCLSLRGEVRAGTEVWVEGAPTEVSREGTFRVDVPRARGRLQVSVVAREPGGASRELSLPCRSGVRAGAGASRVESVKFRWNEEP
ncbi:FecR family protein [Melittangium boletus]|uniref:FecR protein domain-containing protein n=1 Tax=Melittangium boletus DSM 14713 TaxID=1294270 RepID=A0A250INE1_9BACT|nr:FecR family protein [Melittangium boletus]ATB32773.1 hypothetical protein MEBOL_006262 [Melittangium boletus DSM 14713]